MNLNYNEILNCNISYKQLFDISDKDDTDSISPRYSKRVENYLKNNFTDKINKDNLDLSTLLILLKNKGCNIVLPQYENTTVAKTKSNEIIAQPVRNGKIISLKSNQYTFKFSITIADKSYNEKMTSGNVMDFCPKSYSITDDNGNLNDSWLNFRFDIQSDDKNYFNCLLGDCKYLQCKEFVTPQLAQSFYSEYYRIIKTIIQRLVSERKYISDMKKKYLPKCSFFNANDEAVDSSTEVIKESAEQFQNIIVKCFEAKISNIPDFKFNYINEDDTAENIVHKCDQLLNGIINLTGEYKFLARLIEYSFTKVNPFDKIQTPTDFVKYNRCDCKWNEQKVKLPRCRIEWFELMFKEYSILCRYYDKSVKQKIK